MKILLTGATGFVGKALYRELLSREHNLTCAFRKTFDENRFQAEFSKCRNYVVENIDGDTRWSSCLADIDQVVHLAGLAHIPDQLGKSSHRHFFAINHEGTRIWRFKQPDKA